MSEEPVSPGRSRRWWEEVRYPIEVLGDGSSRDSDLPDDDGTMPDNVAKLAESVVGHRIVKAERVDYEKPWYEGSSYMKRVTGLVLTLDNGRQVRLANTSDCCAFTDLEAFLLHPDKVDHVIMGVGTTELYTRWHIYADWGDVLELTVGWSAGNPFYYGYGFDIDVVEP